MAATALPGTDTELARQLWTQDLGREHGFEPLHIEGHLPAGQFGQFGRKYAHPFEADGQTTAIRIADGQALGASRITQSAGLLEERAAGKPLYGLSVAWPRRLANSLRGRNKNTANTSVLVWQDRVFALMEAGKETDLGVIASFFSAHPHRVASRRASYNFGLEYGRVTRLHLYELPDQGPARHLGAVQLPGPPMLHDFIATDTHLIFFISPVRIDVPRMLLQVGSFEQLFRWRPELGTEILAVPIDRPSEPVRFTVDAFYQWHFMNAFGRGSELVVDYVRYAGFDSFHDLGVVGVVGADRPSSARDDGHYHRATIDLALCTLRSERISDRRCEFPTLAPGSEGQAHALGYAVFDDLCAIGSIDMRGTIVSHELPAEQRASEPLYVDGYLLSLCHTAGAAFLAVYDASRIPDGPISRIWLDPHVPITFHGAFARG
jgi:all-trans-8'-apo-beta-carotenal 15,15'-oxygenase